jgi:UDP-N-acetyl-D-mannosaminuronate dehydrogenase
MLVIGLGHIGKALSNILKNQYEVDEIDKNSHIDKKFEFIHVCYPYFEGFEKETQKYKSQYLSPDGICIIHSTVPMGTSKLCGAVHSPIRGIHPDLESGIKTFVKYFGGKDAERAAQIFKKLGIKTETTPNSDTTEALKLWDTTIYAWNVILEKEIYNYCKKYGLDFDLIYGNSSESYNTGYEELGHPEYKKYVLKHMPGPIGGHCLISNTKLLRNWISDIILFRNSYFEP